MNILHTETLYNWGGQQNKIINEMLVLRELGHTVYLFCNPNSAILEKAKELGFDTFECEMNKKNFYKTIPLVCKLIDDKNINLVVTHGSTDSWIGGIAKLLNKKNGVKFLRERHNLFPINSFFSKILHKHLFDKILYISDSVKDYLIQIGVKNEKLFYLPSTIDVNVLSSIKSTFRQEFDIPKEALVIGTFTSLYRKKGVYDFANCAIEILKIYKDAYIVFGGKIKDDIRNELLEKFKGYKNVIFTGFRKDALNIIKAYDVYVFASHSEGLGTVLLEAMSSKTPIVVYDKEPMNILIKNSERGLCANYLDPKSLLDCILKLINNKENAIKFAQNAFLYVSDNYDHKILKKQMKMLMESI